MTRPVAAYLELDSRDYIEVRIDLSEFEDVTVTIPEGAFD